MSEDDWAKVEAAEQRQDKYDQHEARIEVQIFMSIEPSLQIEVQKLKTVKEVWDVLCKAQRKSTIGQNRHPTPYVRNEV